jgi:hypothetical protein
MFHRVPIRAIVRNGGRDQLLFQRAREYVGSLHVSRGERCVPARANLSYGGAVHGSLCAAGAGELCGDIRGPAGVPEFLSLLAQNRPRNAAPAP